MDIIIYSALNGFGVLLGIITMFKAGKIFAIPAFMGAAMLAYTVAGLASDGSVTQGATVLISGSLGSGTWQAVVILPLLLTLMDFIVGGYRGLGKL